MSSSWDHPKFVGKLWCEKEGFFLFLPIICYIFAKNP